MHASVSIGGEQAFQLRHAVLVYGDGRRAFATVHEPAEAPAGGAPVLGEGRPLGTAFLRTLGDQMGHALPAEVLPPQVLVRTSDVTLWWRPRSRAALFLNPKALGKEEAGRLAAIKRLSGKTVAHPALLFRATKAGLWVRALAGNERPTETTPLYQAPYFNVGLTGSVCLGSMRRPTVRGVAAIAQWEQAFFESEFTHQLPGTTLTRHAGGFAGMWGALVVRGRSAPPFRSAWLVPAPKKQTVAAFIAADKGGDW